MVSNRLSTCLVNAADTATNMMHLGCTNVSYTVIVDIDVYVDIVRISSLWLLEMIYVPGLHSLC